MSVTCDDRDRTVIQAIQYPCLIIKVLSESTANDDRGDKFRRYRRNPSLQDYILVDAEKIAIALTNPMEHSQVQRRMNKMNINVQLSQNQRAFCECDLLPLTFASLHRLLVPF